MHLCRTVWFELVLADALDVVVDMVVVMDVVVDVVEAVVCSVGGCEPNAYTAFLHIPPQCRRGINCCSVTQEYPHSESAVF